MDGPREWHMSEVSQTKKEKYCMTSKKKWYKWIYLQNRTRLTDLENELMVAGGGGWGLGGEG